MRNIGIYILYFIKKSLCAEGRPCAPQGLASLVQSLCGCLVRLLVQKPCAEPCADMFPRQPLFSTVRLDKVPCVVPCLFSEGVSMWVYYEVRATSVHSENQELIWNPFEASYEFPKQLLAVRGPGG